MIKSGNEFKYHPKYNGQRRCGFDIGVYEKPENLSHVNNTNWYSPLSRENDVTFQFVKPSDLKVGMRVEVCGYPAEKQGHPYTHIGEIKAVHKTKSGG